MSNKYNVNIVGSEGDVQVSFSKETSAWQAIGLLETALVFLKQEYAKAKVASEVQTTTSEVATTSAPSIVE